MVFLRTIFIVSLIVFAVAIPLAGAEELYRLPTAINISRLELVDLKASDVNPAAEQQAAVFVFKLNPRNLLQFKADLDVLPQNSATDTDTVLLPQMFVAVGDDLYAGLGTHYTIEDGVLIDDPQFSLRAGVDLEILPYIFLDISADYRFDDWRELKEEDAFSEDEVVWGGALRIQF